MKQLQICLLLFHLVTAYSMTGVTTGQLSQSCDIFIRGCRDCSVLNASQCQQCDYNFSLNGTTWGCDCRIAFYLNQNKTDCLVCMDLFGRYCNNCSSSPIDNSTYCTDCSTGYYWNNKSCCSNNNPNCMDCSFDGTQCFACRNNTYLIDGVCSSCPLQCLICDQNLNCTQCRDTQTYLQNGICKNCSSAMNGCSLCSSSIFCLACNDFGYYLLNGLCLMCNTTMFNCSKCSSDNYCSQCLNGTILAQNSSSCVRCIDLFPNCLQCSSFETCDLCDNGQQFIDGVCQTPPSNDSRDWTVVIVLCVIAVIILGVAVFCIIWRCKLKKKKQSLLESGSKQDIENDIIKSLD